MRDLNPTIGQGVGERTYLRPVLLNPAQRNPDYLNPADPDQQRWFQILSNSDVVVVYDNDAPFRGTPRRDIDYRFETWGEVATRVADGNTALVPGTAPDTLRSLIADAICVPAGRHLQHGDKHQPERNQMVFTNCLQFDTRVATLEYGSAKIGELAGKTATVRCADGKWRAAKCSQHGEQELFRLTFGRADGHHHTRDVIATRNHRWFLEDGAVTDNIQVGDKLLQLPLETRVDWDAVVHGLIYGDGSGHKRRRDSERPSVSQGRTYASIRVCKQDATRDEIHDILDSGGYSFTTPAHANGDRVYYIGKMAFAKELPFTTDPEYIAGFIYGWWLADGSKAEKSARGSWCISTTQPDAVDWLSKYAVYAGYTVISHATTSAARRGAYQNAKPLHHIRLVEGLRWKLASIEPIGVEPVYCFEEPETGSFTLANGLVTGNCSTAASAWARYYLLLNGSGVGRSLDDDLLLVDWDKAPAVQCVLSETHPDFQWGGLFLSSREALHRFGHGERVTWHKVADTREGWAKALEIWEMMAYEGRWRDHLLILDFSDVRPKGSPIRGMQGRPSSGPVPTMAAFHKAAAGIGSGLPRWLATTYVEHYFSESVLVGGARRASGMLTKTWRDSGALDFVRIKMPPEYRGLTAEEIVTRRRENPAPLATPLWTSNHSLAVDEEFWWLLSLKRGDNGYRSPTARKVRKLYRAVIETAYATGSGEPGFVNVDKLNVSRANTGVEL